MNVVLLPLPGGQWAAFEPEELAEAIRRARSILPAGVATGSPGIAAPTPPPSAERWLSSQEMADLTGIPDQWWETSAKTGKVPAVYAGKYVRFLPSQALAALPARRRHPADTDSVSAPANNALTEHRVAHRTTTEQPRHPRPDAARKGAR